MTDVFISYSRLDKEFVAKIHEALIAKGQNVWVDWEDIPPSQSWWEEIQKGIARANNIVLILSPYSMGSVVCHMEIEYARQLKKRIIPVLYTPYDRDTSLAEIGKRLAKPEEFTTREIWGNRQAQSMYDANDGDLKHINFFFFRPEDDFKEKFESLFEIIHTDYAYKEQHTTYLLRASEWNRRGRDVSFLLLDTELDQAEVWLQSAPGKEPPPTELQLAYIQASEKRTRQLRNIRRASIIGSLVAVVAFIFALGASWIGVQATQSANLATTREASANIQVANANSALTAVPPTLTQVNLAVVTAQQAANLATTREASANIQVANANGQLTAVPPTLTRVNQAVVTAQGAANIANTQVVNAQATATQIPPTLTQAAIVQEIVTDFSNIMFQVDNPEAQLAQFNKIVEKYPDQATAYEARGAYYDKKGDVDLAIKDYSQALILNPQNSDVYALRASLFAGKGDFDGAIADYNQAIALDLKNSNAYANRGNTRNIMGDYEEALADVNQAIALDPQIAAYYVYRGGILDNMGDFQSAIADFNQAITLDPQSAEAYGGRGYIYLEIGDTKSAIDDLNQAIALDAHTPEYYSNRGMARYSENDLKGAIEDLDQAIALGGQDANVFYNRGVLRYHQNDLKGSIEDYTQAITLNPEDMTFYAVRGLSYLTLYQAETDKDLRVSYLQKAVADYQTAVNLGYEIPTEIQQFLEEAKTLLVTLTPKP